METISAGNGYPVPNIQQKNGLSELIEGGPKRRGMCEHRPKISAEVRKMKT